MSWEAGRDRILTGVCRVGQDQALKLSASVQAIRESVLGIVDDNTECVALPAYLLELLR